MKVIFQLLLLFLMPYPREAASFLPHRPPPHLQFPGNEEGWKAEGWESPRCVSPPRSGCCGAWPRVGEAETAEPTVWA